MKRQQKIEFLWLWIGCLGAFDWPVGTVLKMIMCEFFLNKNDLIIRMDAREVIPNRILRRAKKWKKK